MHKLYEYACNELKDLERKADEKGLSMADVEYADKLTELKKNILKVNLLEDEGYSAEYRDDHHRSYGRRRDGMGRYSRAADDVIGQLEMMLDSAPDDRTRNKIHDLIREMKNV